MKNLKSVFIGLIFVMLISLAAIVKVYVTQEQSHTIKCNTIKETSEYVVDDLANAGCLNIDYLTNNM